MFLYSVCIEYMLYLFYMKQKLLFLLVLILIVGGIFLLEKPSMKKEQLQQHEVVYDVAALNLELEDSKGNIHYLGDFVGKPLILNAWASWCPFCVTELPDFDALQNEFGDDIQIIAINRKESSKDIAQYLDTIEISSKLLFLEDPTDSFYESIQGFSMPETLFINAQGELLTHKRGFMEFEEMKHLTQELF